MEFQRWWVLKSKTFDQESIYSKESIKNPIPVINDGSSIIGHNLKNKVVQKLKLENNVSAYDLLNSTTELMQNTHKDQ